MLAVHDTPNTSVLLNLLDNLKCLHVGQPNSRLLMLVFSKSFNVQVDFLAYTYEQSMPNYKTLQLAFDRIDIRRVRALRSDWDGDIAQAPSMAQNC